MAQLQLSNRRVFRFPRATIFLMLLGFVGTVLAIAMGRTVSMGNPADTTPISSVLPPLFAILAVPFIAAAAAYVILFVTRRSGLHQSK